VKQLGFVIGLMSLSVALWALGSTSTFFEATAYAQAAARDQSGAVVAAPTVGQKNWWEEKFAGSYAELSSFVGTGTFYAGGYRNPYVSNALYLKPTYQLGTKRGLSLSARIYLETEYTQPDNPQARRFYPLDTWFTLAARNLYTNPRSKIRIAGSTRVVVPTSYESRYAHLLTALAVAVGISRPFEFGRPNAQGKRWELALGLGVTFSKNFHSSVLRGNGPGDSTGCMASATLPTESSGASPSGAGSDRCGGPLNTNFSFLTAASAGLGRGRWSLSTALILINQFRYSVPSDAFAATDVPMGRDDATWGVVSVGYEITPRLGVAAGVSSYQPALDARYRYPRFPFFDFSGTNANNFTQLFVNLNGTL
jgi:hypothetical protein